MAHLACAGKCIGTPVIEVLVDENNPCIIYVSDEKTDINLKVAVNIGSLTHPDNKTRLKILNPHTGELYLGNPYDRIMTKFPPYPNSCTGFRDMDKIPVDRRFELDGDVGELINTALEHFRLVAPEDYL